MSDPQTTSYDPLMDLRIEMVRKLSEKAKTEKLSTAEEITLIGSVRILDSYFGIEEPL